MKEHEEIKIKKEIAKAIDKNTINNILIGAEGRINLINDIFEIYDNFIQSSKKSN